MVPNMDGGPSGQGHFARQSGEREAVQRGARLCQVDGHLHVAVGIAGRDASRTVHSQQGICTRPPQLGQR